MRHHVTTAIAVATTALLAFLGGGSTAAAADNASITRTAFATDAKSQCKGWNGVASNLGNGALGILQPPILTGKDLGTPRLEGTVVRADGSLKFYNFGNCSAQVVFKMQTKACGFWGCHWQTKDSGKWEFLWEHVDTGEVQGQVAMECRKGTNSYRIHMETTGVVSTGGEETGPQAKGRSAGVPQSVELDSDQEDGPVVKLSC
jgi:hypothetical protein